MHGKKEPGRRKMRFSLKRFYLCIVPACLAALLVPIPQARAAAGLELYGTFQCMGVLVTLDASDDPNEDAVAAVAYRSGSEAFQSGFPLSRVNAGHWMGSLFRLWSGK